jgi:8-oxo-dGTP pyrophosphatase MutT (NUDIX family)
MNKINLRLLSKALPIHAEEGPSRETIDERVLIETLSGTSPDGGAAAAVEVVRRLFQGLRLLDEPELLRGNWAFISFPAYLVARSIIETLASEGGGWFEPGYWNQTGSVSDGVVEEQRTFLTELERRRLRLHPEGKAEPIRLVSVAWGIIRMGNEFLLVHREDKKRGQDYVFPGGRFNLDDIPSKTGRISTLRTLYAADLNAASAYLGNTLRREINEELGLDSETDYTAEPLYALAPYRKVEGARNNHAYTEYHIVTYAVKLSSEGESRLFDRVSESDQFEWFTVDDLLAPRGRADGKSPFIDALRTEFSGDLQRFLMDIPDSGGTPYRYTKDTDSVDIPASSSAPFRVGKTGKERDVKVVLNSPELALLMVLAAHSRGLEIDAEPAHLRLLGGGWVKLLSPEAEECATLLASKMVASKLPIVQVTSRSYVRLAIDPQLIYFAEANFAYSLNKYELTVVSKPSVTPWATMLSLEERMELDETVTLAIRAIRNDGRLEKADPILEGKKDFDREQREKLDRRFRRIGLRKLIRTEREDYVIAVPPCVTA